MESLFVHVSVQLFQRVDTVTNVGDKFIPSTYVPAQTAKKVPPIHRSKVLAAYYGLRNLATPPQLPFVRSNGSLSKISPEAFARFK